MIRLKLWLKLQFEEKGKVFISPCVMFKMSLPLWLLTLGSIGVPVLRGLYGYLWPEINVFYVVTQAMGSEKFDHITFRDFRCICHC